MSRFNPKRDEAKKLYMESHDTYAQVAQKIGVSTRTVERWAVDDPDGNWVDLRAAMLSGTVVPMRPKKPKNPAPKLEHNDRPVRRLDISEIDILETAIYDVHKIMGTAKNLEDMRAIAGCATALVKLIELRRRLKPPTAAELAEQAIALGIDPQEFAREMREQWLQRA